MKSRLVLLVAYILVCSGGAHAQSIDVKLVGDDEYVARRFSVITKSGAKTSSVAKIGSFNAATNTLLMIGVAGDKQSLPVSDLEKIEFAQEVNDQQHTFQAQAWHITAKVDGSALYTVPQSAFKVAGDKLDLQASWETPRSTTTPAFSEQHGPLTERVAEPVKITYDSAKKAFLIEVQYVTYVRQVSGGGSSSNSSARKPGQ